MSLFGRQDEASKYYKTGMQMSNTRSPAFNLMAAIENLENAVDLRPDKPEYHCALGHIFVTLPILSLTRNARPTFDIKLSAKWATNELEEALRLKPNYGWAACWLVVAYEYVGKRKKAIDTCLAILHHKLPRNAKLLAQYYLKALEKGANENANEEEALKHLKQVKIYGEQGDFARADTEYEEACKHIPDSSWLFNILCQIGQKDGTTARPLP